MFQLMAERNCFLEQMNPNIGAFLGYVASEGHSYFDESNSYAEIGISNTDPIIINHMTAVFKDSFKIIFEYKFNKSRQ